MGVSSSDTSASAARGGDSKIVPQGQTSGEYGNDPYVETKQSRSRQTTPLKPD